MRKILLTSVMVYLCNACTVYAQQPHMHRNGSTAGKTTATGSRLIAVANRGYFNTAFHLDDSTRYAYNAGWGYDFKIDEWKYSSSFTWAYDGTIAKPFMTNGRTFDAGNRTIKQMLQVHDGNNWIVRIIQDYTYDVQGNVATLMYAKNNSNWDSTRYSYTYDAQGQLTVTVEEKWDNTLMQWDNSVRTTNTYNGQGQLTATLYETWVGNQWEDDHRTTYTIVNGQRTEQLNETFVSTWENADRTLYTYNGNGNLATDEYMEWVSSAWEPKKRNSYTYNGSNDVATKIEEVYTSGNYENSARLSMTYNSYSQMEREIKESWDAGSNQFVPYDFDWDVRYYYEEYTNNIEDVAANGNSLHVYPVPAKDVLHLDIAIAKAMPAAVQLYDMYGRVVTGVQLPAANSHNTVMNVSALPAGTYLLQVDAGGEVMTRSVVVQ